MCVRCELIIKEHSDIKIEEHFFRKVFGDSFNLGFHRPKKDQYDICIEYKNAIDKTKIQSKYNTKGTKTQQEI